MQFWDKGVQLIEGCTKVSTGCLNCWSERKEQRFKKAPECLTDGKFNGCITVHMDRLERAAKRHKPTVYAIWNDLYHEGVHTEQIIEAWEIMSAATHHTWLAITKRPERVLSTVYGPPHYYLGGGDYEPNIWHIATTENQEMLVKRLPSLLEIPGNRGLIIEPCLGPVDILLGMPVWAACRRCIGGECEECTGNIHQVILGPENGTGKRSFNEQWARDVELQCDFMGVPFYRKDTEQGELVWRRNA